MRSLFLILLFSAAGLTQDSPFVGKTQLLKDADGKIEITLPDQWKAGQPSGNVIMRAKAPRAHGGHSLIVSREAAQDDVDKQRERYIRYDSGQYAGAEVAKLETPFFGYRMQAPSKDKVMLRAFVTEGDDGLVISLSSPLRTYKHWSKLMMGIMGSVKLGQPQTKKDLKTKVRRVFDDTGVASFVAPGKWRPVKADRDSGELMVIALKGKRTEPHIILLDRGGPTNPDLVLSGLLREWKQNYAGIYMKRLPGSPPRLLAKNRKQDWADYVTTFAVGSHGYAFQLVVGLGSYERYKSVADEMFATLAIRGGPFPALAEQPGDVHVPVRKQAFVHAATDHEKLAKGVAKTASSFFKHWGRLGFKPGKGALPLQIQLVESSDFAAASNGLGEEPVAYNYARGVVVAVVPDKDDLIKSAWAGRLYAALTKACLHRELKGTAPPWFEIGLSLCFDAAGRTGEKPSTRHPAYVSEIERLGDSLNPMDRLFERTHASFESADDVTPYALAWAYTSLMLYGNTPLTGIYRKWKKAKLAGKEPNPKFELGRYKDSAKDLAEYAAKNWRDA